MSIKIMSAVFEDEALGPTERLIMLALADHADDAGRCYPSIARLCKRTGLGERAIQNNLKALSAKGYVTIIPNAGQGLANLYLVTATPAADAPPHEMHPRTKCTSTPASGSKTPAPDAPKPSRTIIEPSEGVCARAPSFEDFWSSWPLSKVGKDAARKAFGRLSPQQRIGATALAAEWCGSWRAANPRLNDIHPSTYLNNKRWEDEMPGNGGPHGTRPQANPVRMAGGPNAATGGGPTGIAGAVARSQAARRHAACG